MTAADSASERPTLVLHIGLPKTGTTYLQHRVFAAAPGLTFVHRKGGAREAGVCHGFRDFARLNAVLALGQRFRLRARLRALAADGTTASCLVVSEENISVLASGFWIGRGSDPVRLARRLAGFAKASDGFLARVKVIIGIRRQDQWLASRYAESSKHFPEFCQQDFEQRLATIAAGRDLPGPLGWLDYDAVERGFVQAIGRENVLVLPLERLAAAPGAIYGELGEFLGGVDLGRRLAPAKGKAKSGRNRLASGENVWRMRAGGELRLYPATQRLILARFAASNAMLGARVPLGFEP